MVLVLVLVLVLVSALRGAFCGACGWCGVIVSGTSGVSNHRNQPSLCVGNSFRRLFASSSLATRGGCSCSCPQHTSDSNCSAILWRLQAVCFFTLTPFSRRGGREARGGLHRNSRHLRRTSFRSPRIPSLIRAEFYWCPRPGREGGRSSRARLPVDPKHTINEHAGGGSSGPFL